MSKNLSVKLKLTLAISLPILLMVATCVVLYNAMIQVKETNRWVMHTHKVLTMSDMIISNAVDIETGMRGFLLAGKDEFLEPYNSGQKNTYTLISQLQSTVSDNPPQVARLQTVADTLKEWQQTVTEPMIQIRRNATTPLDLEKLSSEVAKAKGKTYFDKFRALMAEFKAIEQALLTKREKTNDSTFNSVDQYILIGLAITLLVGVILGYFVTQDLIKKLGKEPHEVNDIASQISQGKLNIQFDKTAPHDSIYGAMRSMAAGLSDMITNMHKSAMQLKNVAEQTTAVANQTSSSVVSQLNENNNVIAAMDELSLSVQEVTTSVSSSTQASKEAIEFTSKGRDSIKATVTNMEYLNAEVEKAASVISELEQDTKNINSIVEAINGIAEQTNLLALNAAIEAARAGEQGRGFAVVADEVRTLAGRTQKSTEEINRMIETLQARAINAVNVMVQSQEQVKSANSQAIENEQILDTIQQAIERISTTNQQISNATDQQTHVVENIKIHVDKVNDLAQDTSSGAMQTQRTGQDLSELANQLNELIGRFRVA